jgi:Tfp pilus assembly protein PilO
MRFELRGKVTTGMIVAAVAAIVLASGVSYQIWLRSKAKLLARDVQVKRQEILRAKNSGLNMLSPEELARLQKRVTAFKRGFVSVSETASILDGISDQAEKSGVKVVGVNSETPVVLKAEGGVDFELGGVKYSRVPIRMQLEGPSRAVADFLRSMAVSSERIFVVDTLAMASVKDRPGVVSCDLTVSFFANT